MIYCTTSIKIGLRLIFTIYYNEPTNNPFSRDVKFKT